jgi:hypothetical protein
MLGQFVTGRHPPPIRSGEVTHVIAYYSPPLAAVEVKVIVSG